MLGRAEEAVVLKLTVMASYGKVIAVSQTEIITREGDPCGRIQFSTCKLELPISHIIHTKVPKFMGYSKGNRHSWFLIGIHKWERNGIGHSGSK